MLPSQLPATMSSLTPSNSNIGAVLSGNNNKNKRSLPKCNSRTQLSNSRSVFKAISTALAVSTAATSAVLRCKPTIGGAGGDGIIDGGSNGGGGGGWWFHGGDGNGGFWSRFFTPPPANADEPPSDEFDSHGLPVNIVIPFHKLSALKKYKISDITFYDRQSKTKLNSDDAFSEMLNISPGGVYNKAQLSKELDSLATSGMFVNVDLEGKTNPDGTVGITFLFNESTWDRAESFRCISVGMLTPSKAIELDPDMSEKEKLKSYLSQEREYKKRINKARPCMLPKEVDLEILEMMKEQKALSASMLQKIRDKVQKWYNDRGYACAQVVNFGNLNTKEVVCEVAEGDISELTIQFLDKLGNVVEGNTQIPIIKREIPKKLLPGNIFNIEAGKQALRNMNSLSLFSNIEVNPRPGESKEGDIVIEVKIHEMEQKAAEVSTEWSITPGRDGYPTLASLQPGGTITFDHRNIKGLNRSVSGTLTTSNFLNPPDDLAFKLEYTHPYWDGLDDRRNRTLHVNCFNSRKISPAFIAGPGVDELPPVWIDRVGVKANITESFTPQSKFTYGLVMEEITTRDEHCNIIAEAPRILPNGSLLLDGPPTSLSGTGVDRMVFLQANITRDNTRFVNGALVGMRNMFQVDQGLGIGTKSPFFNRYLLTVTRFFQLMSVEEGASKSPPPVLVLHGRHGGCFGDLPSYDAFALGGPYSVRGYGMGELGISRNMLEVAAELRVPIKGVNVFSFVEHGNDLGSSKDVVGNPSEVYRRMGQGSSYGVGAMIGNARAEYAIDHNSGTGAFFFRFGDRF